MKNFGIMLESVKLSIEQVQKEFDLYQNEFFTKRPPEFFCLELNGEAGELANAEKKLWKGKDVPHEYLADEAADVLIALMNYSNARKIDLGSALALKLGRIEEKRKELASRGEEY
jgi:NTP pyrophosphatase (non-canonical NTP hydrolase)